MNYELKASIEGKLIFKFSNIQIFKLRNNFDADIDADGR